MDFCDNNNNNDDDYNEKKIFDSYKSSIDNTHIVKYPYYDKDNLYIKEIIYNQPKFIKNTKHPSFDKSGSINDLIIKSKLPLNIDIVSLCGGKCASYTLFFSFLKANYKIIRFHDPYNFKIIMDFDGLFQYIDILKFVKPIYIIDVYRNPIERSIANFLHYIGTDYLPDYLNLDIQDVVDYYKIWSQKQSIFPESMDQIFKYYNIKKPKEFDFERNYLIQKFDNITFIKLKFDDLRFWNRRLSKIFKKPIEIVPSNITKNKYHFKDNNFLESFKKKVTISKTFLDKVMNDENFKFFYSPERQTEIYNEWVSRTY